MNLGFLQVSSLHFGVLSIIMIFFNRYNLRLLALKKKKNHGRCTACCGSFPILNLM